MKRLISLCMALGFACAIAPQTAAAANGVLYECDLTQRDKRVDWLSPKVAVILPNSGQAQVYDSVILGFLGKPIPANVTKRGDNMIVRWSLKGLRDSTMQAIPAFDYTARINMKTSKIHLTANPTSYPNRWTGRGTCKTRTE